MKTTNLKNRWLLHLLSAAIMTIGLTACSSEDSTDDPLKPKTPIQNDDWQIIPANGGTIEKDDITIQFPSGTFGGETKVAVTEVNSNTVTSNKTLSKFYQITLPATGTAKSFSVTLDCEEATDNVDLVLQAPTWNRHTGKIENLALSLESTKANGKIIATIPKVDDVSETDAQPYFTVGLVKGIDEGGAGSRAYTRAGSDYKFKVRWALHHIKNYNDYAKAKVFTPAKQFVEKYVPLEVATIKAKGFEITTATIDYQFEDFDDNETWGYYQNFCFWTTLGWVRLNAKKFKELVTGNYNEGMVNECRATLLHETLHVMYDQVYDKRYAYFKCKAGEKGDEWASLDEACGSWIEKLTGAKTLSKDLPVYGEIFLREFWPHNPSQDVCRKTGYGMSLFIEYLAKKTDDNSIVKLYQYKRNGTSTIREAFDKFLSEKKMKDFDTEYANFAFETLSGKLTNAYNYGYLNNTQIIKTEKSTKVNGDKEGSYEVYNYGVLCNSLKYDPTLIKNNDKNIKVTQNNDGLITDVYEDGNFKLLGSATKGSDLLVPTKELVSGETTKLLVLVTRKAKQEKDLSSLKSDIEVEIVESDFTITKITEIEFNSDLKMRDVETGKEVKYSKTLSKFDKCTIKQNGSTIHVECSFDEHEDYGKSGYNITTRSLSFDIVGFTEDTYGDKYGRIFCNVKNLKCSDYWKRDYGDSMVNYSIWEYEWELSNMNPQYGSKIGYLTFGGEWSHGFFTLDKFSYKETWKDWNKSEQSHTYSIIEDGDNIIALKIEYEYTTKKK